MVLRTGDSVIKNINTVTKYKENSCRNKNNIVIKNKPIVKIQIRVRKKNPHKSEKERKIVRDTRPKSLNEHKNKSSSFLTFLALGPSRCAPSPCSRAPRSARRTSRGLRRARSGRVEPPDVRGAP